MSTAYFDKILKQDLNLGTSTKTRRNPGGGSLTGDQINLASFSVGGKETTTTWDPGSIGAGDFEAKEITVTGAALGDFVMESFSLDVQDLDLNAEVTATNTVTATFYNLTGSGVNLGSGTLSVLVFKSA